ncbi:ribosome assembly RNA-binding protein YhbY [Clostridium niameyense]|uniref:ribosome assembly RNA-binding protein YhbY n=1 Tax=Clostridium niameyense TaxID=1622073 RepID=UPI00067EF552|nr:ribosome assembly RNA-binding protein YhbY [Clostridium niameyense]
MINTKQRSYLRSLANKMDAIFRVGKDGINDNFLKQIDDALEAREIIKVSILKNSDYSAREASEIICDELKCDGVQCIGNKFVLYRRSKKKPKIELP